MDGGKEAVNTGLVRVALSFGNAKSTREIPYIEAYNTNARRWRELCALADRPNAHATPCSRVCARCDGTGCRFCDYVGAIRPQVTCVLTGCETCRFAAICRAMDINLMHMPETGPWQSGYVQPEIQDGWSREGRILPGQLVAIEPLQPSRADCRVFYVVAPLDGHTYLGVRGRRPRVMAGRADSWGAPQFTDPYYSGPPLLTHTMSYNREGQETTNSIPFAGRPLTIIPVDPSWTMPQVSITDYEEVRDAVANRE